MKDSITAAPRRLLDALRRPRASTPDEASHPAISAPPLQPNARPLDQAGLFILGAARSGTTVLQNALNESPDIYLLGEPALHDDPGNPDFGGRYNAMHRAWGNQENKSSFCPAFFERDAPWSDYLRHLATLYRYVGSKIVVNPTNSAETCHRLFDFHCRYFYRAHYIFTFRNPIDVLMSTRGLAVLNGDSASSYTDILRSYVHVIALYIRMLRNLPSVTAVFHESVSETTFLGIGSDLGIDLRQAVRYYDPQRVRHYTLNDVDATMREPTSWVLALYDSFRERASAGFELTQLEQNSRHFDMNHFTPLGALQREVDMLLAKLAGTQHA